MTDVTEAVIREQTPDDREAVRQLNEAAFGGSAEADIVEALQREAAVLVALVAEVDGEVAGHILFSPVTLEPSTPSTPEKLAGLGPMSVAPEVQRRGIGGLLLLEGLNRCRAIGVEAVVVLGYAAYYPRFGFRPAHELGLRCEWEVPPEVFMAIELRPDALKGVGGLVKYHEVFSQV